ncbi:hypothetical protein C8E83_3650 [Frondihabitans australicus]|uniref:Uncharacterized protein n=1 Tax=Frondihabitans australicus TaxID=386892 RepID=A0A495IKI1_9MICO|nr:hypothetical protein C8E83_3650 [Frondihabitans australicus]
MQPVGGVFAAALGAMVAVFGTLVWLGFRNGDRPDDANTSISAFVRPGPPGRAAWVRISIANPAPTPMLVSWRCTPIGHSPWATARTLRSHTVLPWRLDERSFTLLGGVDASATHVWEVPLELTERARIHSRAIRIEVRLDKDARRPRVQTVDLALAS